MNTPTLRCPRRLAAALCLLTAACTDSPTAPSPSDVPVVAIPVMTCMADVRAQHMACTSSTPQQNRLAIAANRILGGQDVYVKLANTGTTYDSGTGIFQTYVTVQNLLADALGTTDGFTTSGVRLFLYDGLHVVAGSGNAEVFNEDGEAFITAPDQPYFEYMQILRPYEISDARLWKFQIDNTVTRFSFTVYMTAPQADESQPLLDAVWDGNASTTFTASANWRGGLVPDSASTVSVPADSLLSPAAFMPVLTADARLTHLRVGFASTMGLAGYTLTAWGNVDAPGTISGGTLRVAGTGALLRGSLPSLRITGSAALQGSTKASGAVSISGGSLNVQDHALSIALP
jgi:hypothetical protein